nr:hypothetical protein CFP56_58134 [Quercus suber]
MTGRQVVRSWCLYAMLFQGFQYTVSVAKASFFLTNRCGNFDRILDVRSLCRDMLKFIFPNTNNGGYNGVLKSANGTNFYASFHVTKSTILNCLNMQAASLSALVTNERDDHRVQVEEEHEEVETEFYERFFLVDVEFAEDLGRVEQVLLVEDPTMKIESAGRIVVLCPRKRLLKSQKQVIFFQRYSLLSVPRQQGQIQQQRHPVSVHQKQRGQERVYTRFGDNVGVETVAKLDGIDVVAFKV